MGAADPAESIAAPIENRPFEGIKRRIDAGLNRRSKGYIEDLYRRCSTLDGSTLKMDRESLLRALQSFESKESVTDELQRRCDILLRSFDRDKDGILTGDEFELALRAPSPLEQWARSLPLAPLLVDALPLRPGGGGAESLLHAGRLEPAEIDAAVDGFAYGLRRILTEQLESLLRSFASMDRAVDADAAGEPGTGSGAEGRAGGDGGGGGGGVGANAFAKYQLDVPKLRCGDIADFHRGLESRIGPAARPVLPCPGADGTGRVCPTIACDARIALLPHRGVIGVLAALSPRPFCF